jgi:hypothetical protein
MIFGLPTASARRRNGFGVVARQQWWSSWR